MKIYKLNIILLILAALWLAAAAYFFIEHFYGAGLFPLVLPILFLAVGVILILFYFYVRKLLKKLESETKDKQ